MSRLITPYAPGSFLKPCVIVSTFYTSKVRETALMFVEALNCENALGVAFGARISRDSLRCSSWVIIAQHPDPEGAIGYHLQLTKSFKNGGTADEWQEGWEPYLVLYERWCPEEMKARHAD